MKKFGFITAFAFSGIMTLLSITGCEEKENIPISDIRIEPHELALTKGDTIRLHYEILPENADIQNPAPSWTSTDEAIATVDSYGLVSAIEKGSCNIILTIDGHETSVPVSVSDISVETVLITPSSANLYIGEEIQLQARVMPEDAYYDDIKWFSSNEYVANVDENGKVTATSTGSSTITAIASGIKGECTINVSGIPVESVTLDLEEIRMAIGDTEQLTATVLPKNADYTLSFESSDENVVSVSEEGLVTAMKAGEATITVHAGDKTDECRITVSSGIIPKVGDFYYSDGTYSTELDADKFPIGIVFYVGDPTSDDGYLKQQHPSCTNGLVVSLYTAGMCAWQASSTDYGKTVDSWLKDNAPEFQSILVAGDYDEEMESICGFNNTEALKKFNAAPENQAWPVDAAKMAEDFITYSYPAAPESSSDWYLPSIKELSILCSGIIGAPVWANKGMETKELINSRISEIPPEYGAQQLIESYYWSSTERDGTYAYYQQFSNPGFTSYVDKNIGKMIAVRCVLAF